MSITDRIPPELAAEDEPFSIDTLDAYNDDADPEKVPAIRQVAGFTITDEGLAEWCMAHVAEIDAGLALADEQHQAYLARINRHHEATVKRLTQRRQFFEAHLVQFARAFRERDPKRNKTLNLPSGQVKSTESRPAATVRDDEAVAEWLATKLDGDALDEAVKVTTKVYVGPFRKLVKIGQVERAKRVTLSCGHEMFTAPEGALPKQLPCMDCEPDPIEGRPTRKVVSVEPDMVPVVVDDAGKPVPGAEVSQGSLTFAVKPS